MTDLTAAEARRLAVDGVRPYRALREVIALGLRLRVIQYPAPLPDKLHPEDAAKLRAAVKAAEEVQAIIKDAD